MDTSKRLHKPSADGYAPLSDQGQQRTSILFPLQLSDPESSGENYTCGKTLSAVRGSMLMLLRTVPSLLKEHGGGGGENTQPATQCPCDNVHVYVTFPAAFPGGPRTSQGNTAVKGKG